MNFEDVSRPLLPWWVRNPKSELSKDEIVKARARHLIDETAAIESRQHAWHEINLWNATLFSNRQLAGFHWGFADPIETELYPANLATENLVKSIGEALLSKASQSPILPVVIPRGASWKTRRLVKRLNRWMQGVWRQLGLEDLAVRAFLDAYLSGIGVVRFDHDGKSLGAEGVFFDNIVVENCESANRTAPKKYRIRYMAPRQVVEQLYNVTLDQDEAKRHYGVEQRSTGKDWIPVVEAWCVGEGGCHCIAAGGCLLKDEPYKQKTPPLSIFKWEDEISGFYSPTGAENVVPYQLRLNELNDVIRDAQDICGRPRLLAMAGSRFDQMALDNLVARVITYIGTPPEPLSWDTMLPELHAERDRTGESAYRYFGLSQMTSQAELPPSVRLDSSAGVREFRVMEDSRFLRLWTRFEAFRLDMARKCVEVMMNDPDAEHTTTWQSGGRARVEEISWSEVRQLTENQYTWSLEAVPFTASNAAARRDLVEGRIAQGRADSEDGKELVTPPDLEAMEDIATARCDEQKWIVEQLEDGEYIDPEPMMNLMYGVQLVTANLALLRQYKGVPEEVKANHRKYVRAALAIIQPGVEEPVAPPVTAPSLAEPIPAAAPPPGASAVRQY